MGGGDHPPDIDNMQIVTSDVVVQEEDYHADVDETMDVLMINHPLDYVGMDKQGTHVSSLYQSPNGSKYWSPQVSPSFKPVVGMLFNDYEEVENMFTAYAEQSGFSARVTAYKKVKDVITHKVMSCSKCGKSKAKPIDTLDTAALLNTRASTSHCTDCPALIRYKLIRGDYKVLLYAFLYVFDRYNMVFVPFTGVDNHKRCVTFGAGLLCDETTESYMWLIRAFLNVHKREPALVLTDQDPAMKSAIDKTFVFAIHRLCMWHIMKKLPTKVHADVLENNDLRQRIHKLVWNIYLTPEKFEDRWASLIKEFKLTKNSWLTDMYAIREMWIPAYFREIPMCCLMKTTSRCESSNAAFKVNSSHANTLVQFLMCYDSSMDQQRYNQRILEFRDANQCPVILTGEDIEKHASQIYTLTMFAEVQKEIIRGKNQCYIMNVDVVDGHTVYDVSHMNHLSVYINTFKVRLNNLEDSYECPCLGFTRNGYLCRHIFSVFRVNAVKEIPGRYIKNRWRRQILPPRLYDIPSRLSVENSDLAVMRSEVMECVSVCIDRLSDNLEGLQLFAADINEIKNGVVAKYPGKSAANKRAGIMEELIGKVDDVSLGLTPPHKAYVTKAVAQTRGWLDPVRRPLRSPRRPQGCAGIATHGVIMIPATAKNRGMGRPHLPSSCLCIKNPMN
ncbi:hypothetical protein SSX86_032148 [Deinandra increscens subsp. villosa]|uniref:SWIM-type domain-containing protein n=1 Tax=Deinandra increscens subsp. villosa TaxID=3103831 RepID=A0AAP0GI54_9ASTR